MKLAIRTATVTDIPGTIALCRIAGWNQLPNDWSRLFAYEPDGCFVVTEEDKVVGSVTSTRYGSELAWIGMMLVHPDYRRQGIATLLMKRVLAYLGDCNIASIRLDATPAGLPVYQRMGFTPEWTFHRWSRPGRNESAETRQDSTCEPPTDALLQGHRELDRRAFGADRWRWIERLMSDSQVSIQPHALGMLRPGFLAHYLGPVIASDSHNASRVIHELLERTCRPVFWDIPQPNHSALSIARSLDFVPVRELTRMVWGSRSYGIDPSSLFALADPSTG